MGCAFKANIFGPKRYSGDAESICRSVVEACWDEDKGYFRTSVNNYPIFYARDFGMCVESLITLGQKERVRQTLEYVLDRYEQHGRLTQQISPRGRPFNFPDVEQPDALAFILHSLVSLNDNKIVERYRHFLENEITMMTENVIDKASGLVKRNISIAGMRDFAVRESSCYDNAMVAAISKFATELGLKNPLQRYDYEKLLMTNFWTGSYFKDDVTSDIMTGDANVAPLWLNVLSKKNERDVFPKILAAIRQTGLDKPIPLRYESGHAKTRMILLDALMSGWERDTVWLHLGNMWLQVVARHDKRLAREYIKQYKELIEHERNYPEVLTREGRPHRSLFFHSDDSMLWAANYLALSGKL